MNYTFNDCTLTLDGKKLEFSKPIWSVTHWRDIVIVQLEAIGTIDDYNNLFGIRNGKYLWQLQDYGQFTPSFLEGRGFHPHAVSYVQIYDKDPQLFLITTGSGWRFTINPRNGLYVECIDWVK